MIGAGVVIDAADASLRASQGMSCIRVRSGQSFSFDYIILKSVLNLAASDCYRKLRLFNKLPSDLVVFVGDKNVKTASIKSIQELFNLDRHCKNILFFLVS